MVSHILTITSSQQYAGIRYFAVHVVSHSYLIRILVLPQQRYMKIKGYYDAFPLQSKDE